MPILALTGPIGSGKSGLQARLQADAQMTALRTFTTRTVGNGDVEMETISLESMRDEVEAGALLAPIEFGGHFYAWERDQFLRALESDDWSVVNIRPYTALLLEHTQERVLVAYLDVDPAEALRRVNSRGAQRDFDDEWMQIRITKDHEEVAAYKGFFGNVIPSNEQVTDAVLKLVRDWNAALPE